jgi:hypothetical protein
MRSCTIQILGRMCMISESSSNGTGQLIYDYNGTSTRHRARGTVPPGVRTSNKAGKRVSSRCGRFPYLIWPRKPFGTGQMQPALFLFLLSRTAAIQMVGSDIAVRDHALARSSEQPARRLADNNSSSFDCASNCSPCKSNNCKSNWPHNLPCN